MLGFLIHPQHFLEKLNIDPVKKETKRIEMMIHSSVRKIDVFEVKIEDLS